MNWNGFIKIMIIEKKRFMMIMTLYLSYDFFKLTSFTDATISRTIFTLTPRRWHHHILGQR